MAIYIVTGKLGGGKTLAAVSRINDALEQGRKVATNLDLNLERLPGLSRKTKNARVIRLPDRPSVGDIEAAGFGIEGVSDLDEARKAYDEERFGMLVLDECGTWLNSRDWQAEGRRELINFLLHIRKHLWDVYLIIQDISMLDKQARKALAEHVVYCRRTDRMKVPVLGGLMSFIWGKRVSMPKMHMAIVKYGDQPQSMTVDRWWYNGTALYEAYDTTQVFTEDRTDGVRSLLAPWYRYRGAFVSWNWRKYVKLTKIYLRQYSRTILLASGIFAGATIAQAIQPPQQPPEAAQVESDTQAMQGESGIFGNVTVGAQADRTPLVYRLSVESYFDMGQGRTVKFTDGNRIYDEGQLRGQGVEVALTGNCRFRLSSGDDYRIVTCF